MKGRESGMPEEAYWASFFDAEAVIGYPILVQSDGILSVTDPDCALALSNTRWSSIFCILSNR